MRLLIALAVGLFGSAHAQSPESVSRCLAQPLQFQPDCFEAIKPKPAPVPPKPPIAAPPSARLAKPAAPVPATTQESLKEPISGKKHFGEWEVEVKKDRFGDYTNVLASTLNNDDLLAVRCLHSDLSIVYGVAYILRGPFRKGDRFSIKFRVDKQPIIEVRADAVNESIMQLETTSEMVREMMSGREYALRISDGTASSDHIFTAERAKEAIAEVVKECPLD
jgi:hypothetical protein